ncbi:MAG: hypothetical protein AB7O49_06380 [Sphingomonadales bacterium]
MTEQTLTVRVPLKLTKRGGRKLVISPEGEQPWAPPQGRIDSTLVKALARAFRWRRQLERGVHTCIRDIARAENINESYVFRVYRLTLLAPEIVEAILDGQCPEGLTLAKAMEPFPAEWATQRKALAQNRRHRPYPKPFS